MARARLRPRAARPASIRLRRAAMARREHSFRFRTSSTEYEACDLGRSDGPRVGARLTRTSMTVTSEPWKWRVARRRRPAGGDARTPYRCKPIVPRDVSGPQVTVAVAVALHDRPGTRGPGRGRRGPARAAPPRAPGRSCHGSARGPARAKAFTSASGSPPAPATAVAMASPAARERTSRPRGARRRSCMRGSSTA